jgi:hypothetical protein
MRKNFISWWNCHPSHVPEFRNGSMPGVHKPRGGNWYRPVRTYPEHRDVSGVEADNRNGVSSVYVRRARCNRLLIDAWDDVPSGAYGNRSWKRYRKSQWKGNYNDYKSA